MPLGIAGWSAGTHRGVDSPLLLVVRRSPPSKDTVLTLAAVSLQPIVLEPVVEDLADLLGSLLLAKVDERWNVVVRRPSNAPRIHLPIMQRVGTAYRTESAHIARRPARVG